MIETVPKEKAAHETSYISAESQDSAQTCHSPEHTRHTGGDKLHGHAIHRCSHGRQSRCKCLCIHRSRVHLHLAHGRSLHIHCHGLLSPGSPSDRSQQGIRCQERVPSGYHNCPMHRYTSLPFRHLHKSRTSPLARRRSSHHS